MYQGNYAFFPIPDSRFPIPDSRFPIPVYLTKVIRLLILCESDVVSA